MAFSSTQTNSLYFFAPTQQPQTRHVARQLTGFRKSILTLSTLTLPSAIVSQSEASNSPSSWLIAPHATIGRLASSLSNTMTSKQPSLLFVMRPAPSLVYSDATATKSCLAALSAHSSTLIIPPLRQVWQGTNHQTAL
jgi:hypothetical protein